MGPAQAEVRDAGLATNANDVLADLIERSDASIDRRSEDRWLDLRFLRELRLYPYLTALSGALVLALGAWMVADRARHTRAHRHGHLHAHVDASTSLGWRSLAALGLAGGVVPSASALVLLLGAISLHRVELGLVLVLAFGVGMAAVLVGVGQLLVGTRGFAERRVIGHRRLGAARGLAPNLSAAAVLLVGLAMTAQSLAALL